MEIKNCPRCGKLFTQINEPICDDCIKKEDEIFRKVKEYIEDHRECTLDEVAKETEVSMKRIMRYLREGRIEISKTSTELRCGQCGRPITTGEFCDSCVISLNQQVQDMLETSKKRTGGAVMHTRHK